MSQLVFAAYFSQKCFHLVLGGLWLTVIHGILMINKWFRNCTVTFNRKCCCLTDIVLKCVIGQFRDDF